MTVFNMGWWNCFNSFANNCYMTKSDNLSACLEVLKGAGVTKKEVEEVLRSGELYGNTESILESFLKLEE